MSARDPRASGDSRPARAGSAATTPFGRRPLSTLFALVLATSLALSSVWAPSPANAVRLGADEVGGVALDVSGLHDRAPDIEATSGMLLGPDGRVLWARDTESRRAIASITKVMTALVVLERADLDDRVTVSDAASRVPYATGLQPGEVRTVRELLELALVASSNDAAHALAEHVGGSVAGFATLMNERAAEMGLRSTRFVNPHGLDAEGHHSSAEDVASMMCAALTIQEYRRIVALPAVTLTPYGERTEERTVENTDHLLGVYGGLLGGKTGFTNSARYCFTGAAERDGVALTAIVLGAPSSAARFDMTSRLLDWGFEHLTVRTIATATETIAAVPLEPDPARTVEVRFPESTATVVFALDGEIDREVSLPHAVPLPVFEGQPLGEVTLVQGERVLATLPAVASHDIASAEETVGLVPVADYLDRAVVARATGEALDVPEFDPDTPVERAVLLDPDVRAPVESGDRVGTIAYSQNGSVFLEVPVVSAEDIEAPGALERLGIWLGRAWRWVTGRPTMAQPEVALS